MFFIFISISILLNKLKCFCDQPLSITCYSEKLQRKREHNLSYVVIYDEVLAPAVAIQRVAMGIVPKEILLSIFILTSWDVTENIFGSNILTFQL